MFVPVKGLDILVDALSNWQNEVTGNALLVMDLKSLRLPIQYIILD